MRIAAGSTADPLGALRPRWRRPPRGSGPERKHASTVERFGAGASGRARVPTGCSTFTRGCLSGRSPGSSGVPMFRPSLGTPCDTFTSRTCSLRGAAPRRNGTGRSRHGWVHVAAVRSCDAVPAGRLRRSVRRCRPGTAQWIEHRLPVPTFRRDPTETGAAQGWAPVSVPSVSDAQAPRDGSCRTAMVPSAGIEPATPGLGNRCSIH